MTAKEVWERLGEEMAGQARQAPHLDTVRRWLKRWVEGGVLVDGKKRIVLGSDKPVPSYTLPPSHARALSIYEGDLPTAPRERLQEQEKENCISDSSAEPATSFLDATPVPESKAHAPESGMDAISNSSVPEGDYEEQIANDIPGDISRARAREELEDWWWPDSQP